MRGRVSNTPSGGPRRSGRAVAMTTRALTLAFAAVMLSGAGSFVAARKAPPAGPPLKVEPFQVYRPESTGGYVLEEYGQTSIWWRFTTQRDGGGRFTLTFPRAPEGTKGFEPLQLWNPPVTPIDAANVVAVAAQQSWCRPTITELVSGNDIDQMVAVKYPKTCATGNTFNLQWRGPLYWNGFADTNGPDAEPNPHDRWSFPVKMWAGGQPTSTTTSIEVMRFPAYPVGLEPLEFSDPDTAHPDATVPMLMIDMVATPVYLEQPALSAYVPESLVAAGRDSSGAPIESNITIIAGAVFDQSGNLVDGVTPLLTDPGAALHRTVVEPIVIDDGCGPLNAWCPPDAEGYIVMEPDGYIDQSGDPIPGGHIVMLAFTTLNLTLSGIVGARLLCESYRGVYWQPGFGEPNTGWTCSDLPNSEVVDLFTTEILLFRPTMGTFYCPSRIVKLTYPSKVECDMRSMSITN